MSQDPEPASGFVFEAIYSSWPFLFCILDNDGVIRRVNAAAEAFFGYSFEELLGHRLMILVHPADRSRAMIAIAQAGEATTGLVVLRVEWGRGVERCVKWAFTRMPNSDLVVGWGVDVTEVQMHAEDDWNTRRKDVSPLRLPGFESAWRRAP